VRKKRKPVDAGRTDPIPDGLLVSYIDVSAYGTYILGRNYS